MSEETYHKLPGAYRTPMGKWTLWTANDHLMLIHSSRVAEQYRRFYFRDIQAIVLRKRDGSPDRLVVRAVIAAILGVLFLISYRNASGGLSSLLLFGYLFWWLRRPDCVCQIVTAVQTERIPSLCRYRTASRVIAGLLSKIDAAQGERMAGVESSEPQPPPLV